MPVWIKARASAPHYRWVKFFWSRIFFGLEEIPAAVALLWQACKAADAAFSPLSEQIGYGIGILPLVFG
ncbi:MAG: hypothetical protein HQL52_05000 [Magnetococcales bacterium]|nr:hypothetical protein [Magnetococcales bacterium]